MTEEEKTKNDIILKRINLLIKQSGLTQSEVSEKCNFNTRRLQNLSGGHRLPDCDDAVKIAKVLNTTVEYLVTGESGDETEDEIKLLAAYRKLDPMVKQSILSHTLTMASLDVNYVHPPSE